MKKVLSLGTNQGTYTNLETFNAYILADSASSLLTCMCCERDSTAAVLFSNMTQSKQIIRLPICNKFKTKCRCTFQLSKLHDEQVHLHIMAQKLLGAYSYVIQNKSGLVLSWLDVDTI